MAEISCRPPQMLSDRRALSARVAVYCFVKKTSNSKNTRRLQTLSIQHCIAHRLRRAFSVFKRLLSCTVRWTAGDWHRHRFLASIFGRWLTYVNDEKLIENTLLSQGDSCYRMVCFKQFKMASRLLQVRRRNGNRKIHLGIAYYSCLSLLRSFEILSVRKKAKCLARSAFESAERFHYFRSASSLMSELSLDNIHQLICC